MLKQGEVIHYPYLWRWQAERGETEGRKDRPVCVALSLRRAEITHVFLLAITSAAPRADRIFLQIPETELRRIGLRDEKVGYVILDECNYDIVEQSFYLDLAGPPLGRFSGPFMDQIKNAFSHAIQAGDMTRIDRG